MPLLDDEEYQKHHVDPKLHLGFSLDTITVLPKNGEIIRDGARYHLTPKALEVLIYLANHNNKVVSAESLLEFAWGSKKTNRSNLSHVISEIRHALDDHKECPEFIQTFPRKGYRLIGKVDYLEENILYPDIWPIKNSAISPRIIEAEKRSRWHFSLALFRNSKLFSVSIAFIVSTWALLQVFEILFPIFDVPEWGLKIVVLFLVIGFPLVLLFTWLKEIKVKGYLTKSSELNPDGSTKPIEKRHFYKQLGIDFSFIGILSLGVGFVALYLIESIQLEKQANPEAVTESALDFKVQDDLMAVLKPKFEDESIPDYFKATFQNELSNALSKQKFFKVVSPRAVVELSDDSSINEISNKLGARYLLDTIVVSQGNSLSVTLSLIDGKTLLQIWTSKLKGAKDKLLTLQKEANQNVATAFLMLADSNQELNMIIDTENFKSYDSYIQGKRQLTVSNDEVSFTKAQFHFLESLSFDPNFTLANAGLCQSYLNIYEVTHRIGTFETAANQCGKLLQSENLKEDGLLALGNLYRISGDQIAAIGYFEEAIQIAPDNVDILTALAKSYSEKGEIEKAENLLLKTISLEPGYWKNYLALGDFYFGQGRFADSTEQYAVVTLLKPMDAQSFNRLGAAYYLNNQMAQASEAWTQSLKISPSANIYSNLATSLFFKKDFKAAEENYLLALEMKQEDPILWGNLADSQKFLGKIEEASLSYQNALRLVANKLLVNPSNVESLSEQARYLSELKECHEAIRISDSLVKKEVSDPYIYYALAIVQINCGNLSEAKNLMNLSISLGYSQTLLEMDIQFEPLRNKT